MLSPRTLRISEVVNSDFSALTRVLYVGTTLTLAVLSGWLLTIANTGDSSAIVDCGDDVQEITHSHRIQVCM